MKYLILIALLFFTQKTFSQNDSTLIRKVIPFLIEKKQLTFKEVDKYQNSMSMVTMSLIAEIDTCKNVNLFSFSCNSTHSKPYFFLALSDSIVILDDEDVFNSIQKIFPYIHNNCNTLNNSDRLEIVENIISGLKRRSKNFRSW
jgi:hypothetical protein